MRQITRPKSMLLKKDGQAPHQKTMASHCHSHLLAGSLGGPVTALGPRGSKEDVMATNFLLNGKGATSGCAQRFRCCG